MDDTTSRAASPVRDARRRNPPIRITVDHRERWSEVFSILQGIRDLEMRVEQMALGDYVVDGTFLLERKSMPDLVASIKDGRLFRQACRLAADPRRAAFVLEGGEDFLEASGMRREAILGALVCVSLMFGLPCLRTRDAGETVQVLLSAARQARAASTGAVARRIRRPKGKRRAQVQVLQGLPGIGPERAGRLLDAFGSVAGVIGASDRELQSVDGVGPGTARKIRWVVEEPRGRYGASPSSDGAAGGLDRRARGWKVRGRRCWRGDWRSRCVEARLQLPR